MLRMFGRVLFDQRNHAVAKRFAQLVPGALAQRVGRVLQEDPHDVLAGRRERRIVHGRDGQFQQRTLARARPYLASSQARSTYSMLGQMCMVARWCGPGAPG